MPVLFLPWALYPRLYKNIKSIDIHAWPFKFLAAATIPVFISFSLIVGKQPHYLLPLLPSAIILVAYTMEAVNLQKVRNAALWMLVLTISLLIGASQTLFRNFHLETLAPIYQENSDRDWAFVHKYQGELGFVARVEKHIDSIDLKDLPEWFKNHPDGFAFVRYGPDNDLEAYEEVMSIPYRGKDMGVFKKSGKI